MGAKPQRHSQLEYLKSKDQPAKDDFAAPPGDSLAALRAARRALRGSRLALRHSRLAMEASLAKRAFSLIELIGVLAVVSMLAVMTVPKMVKRVDRATWAKEVGDLNTISNALMLHMVRSNVIPSETTWAGAAANWFTRPASQILTNNRGYARLFFYDSGGWLNGKLPYTNGVAGAGVSAPSGARVAIVSTIATALPYANGALSTADFNSLWNATPGATPSYLTSHGWTGSGDDLVIQRINLDPLFHHLVLTTRDSSTTAGYSINSSSSSNAVPNTPSGLNSYYFDGTTVGLWSGVTLTNRFLLTRDISYTFDGGMWQAQLTGASQDNGAVATNFAYQAGLFIHTDNVPGGHQGASAQSLLSAFYGFMYGYTVWANECPHFQNNASSPGQQTDYQFLNALGAQSGIIDATAGSSGGGLLK